MTEELKTYLKENVEQFFTDEGMGRTFDSPKLLECLKERGVVDQEEVREAAKFVIQVGMNLAE